MIPGFRKLCSVFKLFWFLVEINPLLPTSKALTSVCIFWISTVKCAYLSDFSVCLFSKLCSMGTVNSKMLIEFDFSSIITIIRFLRSYADICRDCSTIYSVFRKICINFEFCGVYRLDNVVDQIVVAPQIFPHIKRGFTAIQYM